MALENLVVAFFTGLAVSLGHCLGMCGSIVAAYTFSRQGATSKTSRAQLQPQIVLNAGRLLTYGILGAAMGLAGSLLDLAGNAAGLQGFLSVIVGAVMLFVGLSLAGVLPSVERISSPLFKILGVSQRVGQLLQSQSPWTSLGIGLLWGLFPCGMVFAMEMNAAATGNAIQGALVMMTFGLGTVPALLGFSLASLTVSGLSRQRLMRISAILILVFAVQSILRGLSAAELIPSLTIGGVMLW